MVPATTALTATRRLMVSGRAIFPQTCAAAACTLEIACRTLTAPNQASFLSGLGKAYFVCHSGVDFWPLREYDPMSDLSIYMFSG